MKYSAGLIPIDTLILQHMTPEGTELAEFIPLGPSTKALAKRIDGITSNQVSGRIRTLEREGMCVPIPLLPASQGRGWQRTPKGDEFLNRAAEAGVVTAITEFNATINTREAGDRHRDPLAVRVPESGVPTYEWENAVHEGKDEA